MATNHPWAELHGDLRAAKNSVYDPGGFSCSRPVPEPESADYAAHRFTLDGQPVAFRVARTTPTKAGRFVTVWRRSTDGPIRPFDADADDGVDLFVIGARDDGRFGQFVFPRDVLGERGIVSRNGVGGKRGFRVYPPGAVTTSRQARGTQAWQVRCFLDIGEGASVGLVCARALYHP
ncbi:MepB family protein [Streptomyces sp. PTY087I2]|uniref:MepB family protein n=1 Tax=Streptomyces sp. PTY087I2 TaxID=1819298 RepID=UPI00080BE088|nr:MepB family protein [Streptomyces sp. PTY087I2]OCC07927.1 MepB protein [Streptomyces sp. PTY087I2]